MSRLFLRLFASLGLVMVLATGSVWAQGRGHGRAGGNNQVGQMGGNIAWGWGNDNGRRDPWSFGTSRPRGWDRGRKTGWGNCDMPPGQAKKYGCGSNSSFFLRNRRDRDRDWDRDRNERREHDRDRYRDRPRDDRYRR